MIEIQHKLTGGVLLRVDAHTLEKADLSGTDLTDADLREMDLSEANLMGAKLQRANLRGANLHGANLRAANLRDANPHGANLHEANLTNANLTGANLTDCSLHAADLTHASLRNATLTNANLTVANLRNANLRNAELVLANLNGANLTHANLRDADLRRADLTRADLSDANLRGVDLTLAKLSDADLRGADLTDADLTHADLRGADLRGANLYLTNLNGANLAGADLTHAFLWGTVFVHCRHLHEAVGLAAVHHEGPSSLDLHTLRASIAHLPDVFLQGVGYARDEIEHLRALYAQPLQFHSCFLSHAESDSEFTDRLQTDLTANAVNCWRYFHDLRGGWFWRTQVNEGMKRCDNLVLICSKESIFQRGIADEVTAAINYEQATGAQKLFPVRLDDFILSDEILAIADEKLASGEWHTDWVRHVRSLHIFDFCDWRNEDAYESALRKLLEAMKVSGKSVDTPPHFRYHLK